MTSVKLKFRASTIQEKKGRLYFQITHLRTVRILRTQYQLFSHEWDFSLQCILVPPKTHPRYKTIKHIFEQTEKEQTAIKRIIQNLSNFSTNFSTDDILNYYQQNKTCKNSFFEFAQKEISRLRLLGRKNTAKNHEAALHSFKKYRQGKDIDFTDINSETIEEYEAFLKSRGNCRNTTSFYIRNLRSIYHQAIEQSPDISSNIFRHVYTGVDKTIKRAISMKDIRRIIELDLTSHPTLQLARDLFIFSFYTRGMSFIDLAYLRKKDIKGENLIYRRCKTGQQLSIRWEKEMQIIINRHPTSTQYLLPIITREDGTEYRQYKNAMMLINRKLKKIGVLAGIPLPLSMYTSRHSWATIAHNKRIPLSIISKGLGHNSEVHTQIYLASIETREVDKANRKILHDLEHIV